MKLSQIVYDDEIMKLNITCWYKLIKFIDEKKIVDIKNNCYYIENQIVRNWLQNVHNTIILFLEKEDLVLTIIKKILEGEIKTKRINNKYSNRLYFSESICLKQVRKQMKGKKLELS